MARVRATALTAVLVTLSAVPAAGVSLLATGKLRHRAGHRGKRAQHAQRLRGLLAAVSGECRCLNWKAVFTRRGGECGHGYEHFLSRNVSDTGSHLKASLFQELWEGELCDRLYSKLDTDSCVQQNMGEGSSSVKAGWCYVNSTCRSEKLDLRNLSKAGGDETLSLRMCVPGVDRFLYTKSPQELQRFATDHGIDMGHLVKMTYPTMSQSWENVAGFFLMNKSLLANEGSARLKRVAERGGTVVWSSRNGLPPFGVTQGTRTWEVGLRNHARKSVLSDPNNVEVWANVTKFRCVTDCSANEHLGKASVLRLTRRARRTKFLQLGVPGERGRGVVQTRRSRKHRKI